MEEISPVDLETVQGEVIALKAFVLALMQTHPDLAAQRKAFDQLRLETELVMENAGYPAARLNAFRKCADVMRDEAGRAATLRRHTRLSRIEMPGGELPAPLR